MSNQNEEMVTITESRLSDLKEAEMLLAALEEAGVDNWQGYDEAREILSEWKEQGVNFD